MNLARRFASSWIRQPNEVDFAPREWGPYEERTWRSVTTRETQNPDRNVQRSKNRTTNTPGSRQSHHDAIETNIAYRGTIRDRHRFFCANIFNHHAWAADVVVRYGKEPASTHKQSWRAKCLNQISVPPLETRIFRVAFTCKLTRSKSSTPASGMHAPSRPVKGIASMHSLC